MTDPVILSRVALGLKPRVVNFNHITSRPLLRDNLGLVVVHHPGSRQRFANADLGAVVRGVERWKPGLYSYFIHPNGTIGTQAGRYRSAATKGHNDEGYSVNILVGEGEQITDNQIGSFRFLVGALAWSGAINKTPFIAQHGWLVPTECPGPSIKARWADLTDGLRWA